MSPAKSRRNGLQAGLRLVTGQESFKDGHEPPRGDMIPFWKVASYISGLAAGMGAAVGVVVGLQGMIDRQNDLDECRMLLGASRTKAAVETHCPQGLLEDLIGGQDTLFTLDSEVATMSWRTPRGTLEERIEARYRAYRVMPFRGLTVGAVGTGGLVAVGLVGLAAATDRGIIGKKQV